jgi:hypothetical protein
MAAFWDWRRAKSIAFGENRSAVSSDTAGDAAAGWRTAKCDHRLKFIEQRLSLLLRRPETVKVSDDVDECDRADEQRIQR